MKTDDRFTHTSNTVKLLKHLNTLKDLQTGKITPIMVHTMPTHRCQLNCSHCCFKNRNDLVLDFDLDLYKTALEQFKKLGTKAMELTGGGEPLMYPYINELLEHALKLEFKIGLITNGLNLLKIKDCIQKLSWIRMSLNTLDYIDSQRLKNAMELLQNSKVHYSFCYIWNEEAWDNIPIVAKFSKRYKSACRVSPDCIQDLKAIDRQLKGIRKIISKTADNEYLFLSDFNTTLTRRNQNCYIHLIKPALYTDGYLYPCPSAELAVENNKQINTSARLCRADEIYDFYRNGKTPQRLEHTCSYCKYSKQQDILEDLFIETDDNEFA